MKEYSPYSSLKIFHHVDRIKGLLEGKRVAPIYIRIKPTNVCNQNCYYCVYANNLVFEGRNVDRRESIEWSCLEQVLYQSAEMGVKAITFSGGGEPLCYHSIDKALELVQGMGIDYSMITNGQALEGKNIELLKNAKWVRISFDSSNAKTYERVRGVNTYNNVVRNIEQFAKRKSGYCTLGINCVITKQNFMEIYDICKLAKELGVGNIKLSPIVVKKNEGDYHDEISSFVVEQIEKAKSELECTTFSIVDKYTDDIGITNRFIKNYERCLIQEFFTVIAADSKVYRCHQRAYLDSGLIGDLTEKPFKEIWYSDKTIRLAREYNACQECQFRCAFDERNILLNDFLNIDKDHVNFI